MPGGLGQVTVCLRGFTCSAAKARLVGRPRSDTCYSLVRPLLLRPYTASCDLQPRGCAGPRATAMAGEGGQVRATAGDAANYGIRRADCSGRRSGGARRRAQVREGPGAARHHPPVGAAAPPATQAAPGEPCGRTGGAAGVRRRRAARERRAASQGCWAPLTDRCGDLWRR